MVLPSTGCYEALEFAERLHHAFNQAALKFDGSALRCTVSIGLVQFDNATDDDIDDLLARADPALYQARQGGRNQTVAFDPQLNQAAAS